MVFCWLAGRPLLGDEVEAGYFLCFFLLAGRPFLGDEVAAGYFLCFFFWLAGPLLGRRGSGFLHLFGVFSLFLALFLCFSLRVCLRVFCSLSFSLPSFVGNLVGLAQSFCKCTFSCNSSSGLCFAWFFVFVLFRGLFVLFRCFSALLFFGGLCGAHIALLFNNCN